MMECCVPHCDDKRYTVAEMLLTYLIVCERLSTAKHNITRSRMTNILAWGCGSWDDSKYNGYYDSTKSGEIIMHQGKYFTKLP